MPVCDSVITLIISASLLPPCLPLSLALPSHHPSLLLPSLPPSLCSRRKQQTTVWVATTTLSMSTRRILMSTLRLGTSCHLRKVIQNPLSHYTIPSSHFFTPSHPHRRVQPPRILFSIGATSQCNLWSSPPPPSAVAPNCPQPGATIRGMGVRVQKPIVKLLCLTIIRQVENPYTAVTHRLLQEAPPQALAMYRRGSE